ncbi:hypothetical protein DPMN_098351 [Dreissena polymorpha]|uniref:Uncharacterized protein n=1 Tax=Dreissena polymorpha TaxID=45954 RepID=A0A9D4R6L5_DREPO|nr:hypothetical protein DPMN_098351 [Dreissena polymorpha]
MFQYFTKRCPHAAVRWLMKTGHPEAIVISDTDGNQLTEGVAVLNGWTEACSDIYNYPPQQDTRLIPDQK